MVVVGVFRLIRVGLADIDELGTAALVVEFSVVPYGSAVLIARVIGLAVAPRGATIHPTPTTQSGQRAAVDVLPRILMALVSKADPSLGQAATTDVVWIQRLPSHAHSIAKLVSHLRGDAIGLDTSTPTWQP